MHQSQADLMHSTLRLIHRDGTRAKDKAENCGRHRSSLGGGGITLSETDNVEQVIPDVLLQLRSFGYSYSDDRWCKNREVP